MPPGLILWHTGAATVSRHRSLPELIPRLIAPASSTDPSSTETSPMPGSPHRREASDGEDHCSPVRQGPHPLARLPHATPFGTAATRSRTIMDKRFSLAWPSRFLLPVTFWGGQLCGPRRGWWRERRLHRRSNNGLPGMGPRCSPAPVSPWPQAVSLASRSRRT